MASTAWGIESKAQVLEEGIQFSTPDRGREEISSSDLSSRICGDKSISHNRAGK
jgi:hypothetical protein